MILKRNVKMVVGGILRRDYSDVVFFFVLFYKFVPFILKKHPLGHVKVLSTVVLIPSCDSTCEVRYSYVQKLESLVPILNRLKTI